MKALSGRQEPENLSSSLDIKSTSARQPLTSYENDVPAYPIIFVVQNILKAGLGMTTSYFEGVILSKHTLVISGRRYIIRLSLISGKHGVLIEWPLIWPITLLSRQRVDIAIHGPGFGKVLRGVGRF